jgi:hypothetical protein
MPDSSLETIAKVGKSDTTRALPRRSPAWSSKFMVRRRLVGKCAGSTAKPPAPAAADPWPGLAGRRRARSLSNDRPLCGGRCVCLRRECVDQCADFGPSHRHRVRSNAPVKNDDVLFNIDPEPYRIALANAEAQLWHRTRPSTHLDLDLSCSPEEDR